MAFIVLALAVVRWETFRSFLRYQLPRLSNGDAFPWMEGDPERMARAAAENLGVYGLVKKLEVLGVPWMSRHAAQVTAQVYGVLVIGLALVAARKHVTLIGRAQLWLALLTLASLRSPFAPSGYATIGTLWLVLLIATERPGSKRWLAAWGAAFAMLWALESRTTERPPLFDVWVGLCEQVFVLALNLWIVVRRAGRPGKPFRKRSGTVDSEQGGCYK